MNMNDIYREKAQELIDQGYTSEDMDQIAEENFMLEEDAEIIREYMEEIEEEMGCTDTE